MREPRKPSKVARVGAGLSLALHVLVIGGLVVLAAREGMLGTRLKTIAVTMLPKEKPPEPPKEKPLVKPPDPVPETKPPVATPPPAAATPPPAGPPPAAPAAGPPPATAPLMAPPPAELPSFAFEGGKVVEAVTNPKSLYRGLVEYTLRSQWKRPEGVDDLRYAAEVELAIDPSGRVLASEWKRGSGDAAWDASVRRAVAATPAIGRPPPEGFPARIIVRFDAIPEVDALTP